MLTTQDWTSLQWDYGVHLRRPLFRLQVWIFNPNSESYKFQTLVAQHENQKKRHYLNRILQDVKKDTFSHPSDRLSLMHRHASHAFYGLITDPITMWKFCRIYSYRIYSYRIYKFRKQYGGLRATDWNLFDYPWCTDKTLFWLASIAKVPYMAWLHFQKY